MSPVVGFEALNIHTALYLTGQIVIFFTHKNTKSFFSGQVCAAGILTFRRSESANYETETLRDDIEKERTFRKPAITTKISSLSRLRQAHFGFFPACYGMPPLKLKCLPYLLTEEKNGKGISATVFI
jgi:hypothetical protein